MTTGPVTPCAGCCRPRRGWRGVATNCGGGGLGWSDRNDTHPGISHARGCFERQPRRRHPHPGPTRPRRPHCGSAIAAKRARLSTRPSAALIVLGLMITKGISVAHIIPDQRSLSRTSPSVQRNLKGTSIHCLSGLKSRFKWPPRNMTVQSSDTVISSLFHHRVTSQ